MEQVNKVIEPLCIHIRPGANSNNLRKEITEKLIRLLENKGYKIATTLRPATKFWSAETYHQQYYEKTGGIPYCHARRQRF